MRIFTLCDWATGNVARYTSEQSLLKDHPTAVWHHAAASMQNSKTYTAQTIKPDAAKEMVECGYAKE